MKKKNKVLSFHIAGKSMFNLNNRIMVTKLNLTHTRRRLISSSLRHEETRTTLVINEKVAGVHEVP